MLTLGLYTWSFELVARNKPLPPDMELRDPRLSKYILIQACKPKPKPQRQGVEDPWQDKGAFDQGNPLEEP